MKAIGRDVQYCAWCETGRAKKAEWFAHPLVYHPLRDRNGNVIKHDWLGTGRAAEEEISRTLPDLDDLSGVA